MAAAAAVEEKADTPVVDERRKWKCRIFIIGAGIVTIAVAMVVSFVLIILPLSSEKNKQELPPPGPNFNSDYDDSSSANSNNSKLTSLPTSFPSPPSATSLVGGEEGTTITTTTSPTSKNVQTELPTSRIISTTMPVYEPSQSFPSESPTITSSKNPSTTGTSSPITSPSSSPTEHPTTTYPEEGTLSPTSRPTKLPIPQPTNLLITSVLPTTQEPTSTSPTPQQPLTKTPTAEPTTIPTLTPTIRPTTTQPSTRPSTAPATTIEGSYELLEIVPHDTGAFTQGLELIQPLSSGGGGGEQYYYESTGLYGQSTIRIVNLVSGEVLMKYDLPSTYFGEGMTHFDNGKLIQITWKEQTAFIYNSTTLELIEIHLSYTTTNGEGWGICFANFTTTDDEAEQNEGLFFVTDGTHYLHQWNSSSFEFLGKVPVHTLQHNDDDDLGGEGNSVVLLNTTIDNLNELEWDRHTQTVLSNIWHRDYLVRINPKTGFVTHRYDLGTLYPRSSWSNAMNGIAITDTPNEIWVTGKRWPNMYRIRLLD